MVTILNKYHKVKSHMKLTFITNLVNHHQIPIADELFKILGNDYTYVAMEPLPDWLKQGGYSEIERPYIIRPYENEKIMDLVKEKADNSDVVIIGSAPEYLVQNRLDANKVTFHYSERWFKDGYYHLLSPRALWSYWKRHTRYRSKRSYMLCASAFTAPDVHKVFAYPGKCFKWGYFTKVDDEFPVEASPDVSTSETLHTLMWCARFLKLKHPELPILLARKLKDKGYSFKLDMFGSGVVLEKTKSLAKKKHVEDVVSFKGNLPNAEILKEMRMHDIFLFTSDKNEGWGAVVNESMSSGCAFVGSDAIGAVPFLVKNGENGLIFKSEDIDSLTEKVIYLLDNPEECKRMARNAYLTMKHVWSPQNAAKNLITLSNCLLQGKMNPIKEGPCSPAI